jgi:PKHD-type hydroxylase
MIYPIQPGQNNYATCAYWGNFFTEYELDHILALPAWNNSELSIMNHENQPWIRASEVAWMEADVETKGIWKKLNKVFSLVNQKYFRFDLTGFYEPAQLSSYSQEINGHYDWHIDIPPQSALPQRKLSMSLLLNDPREFQGGDLEILDSNNTARNLEFVRGRAWFFPSYTIHRVTPVTEGVRRSLVVWAGGPDLK